jgi:hypothetical protein
MTDNLVPALQPREEMRQTTRVRFKPTTYSPSFTGKSYAMTQQEVVLHPDAHMETNLLEQYLEPEKICPSVLEARFESVWQRWQRICFPGGETDAHAQFF